MSTPSIVEALDQMKKFAETPVNERPTTCPLNAEQRQAFVQKYGNTLHSCPAFESHKCPFDHVSSVDDLHRQVSQVPNVEKCPAFDHHHGELMETLYPDAHKQ
jgi:hypothetical protein